MLYKVKEGYEQNNKTMYPAYLRDYNHYFYANLDTPIDDDDFALWVLDLYDMAGNQVSAGVGILTKDIISGGDYRFYAHFTIPVGVDRGLYQLVVYNSSTSDLKYVTNCIEVITSADVEEFVFLWFRNSTNAFGFNYETLTSYNTVFLNMNIVEEQPEISMDQYREASTGKIRNQKTQTAKVLSLETFMFDGEANDMMLALSSHDDIQLNAVVVKVKEAFKIETNKFNSLKKGIIEVYDQAFSTINLNG